MGASRRFWFLFLPLTLVSVFLAALSGSADAQTPFTGSPTPAPTGTPTQVSYDGHSILVRFFYQGQPLIYDGKYLGTWLNGEFCEPQHADMYLNGPVNYVALFPVRGQCTIQPGDNIRACFDPGGCLDVTWEGQPIILPLEIPRDPKRQVVTTHFVKNGDPVSGTLSNWNYEGAEMPIRCAGAVFHQEELQQPATSAAMFWPPHTPVTDPSCATPGTKIVATIFSEVVGSGRGTFVVGGQDVEFDMSFDPAALPSPGGPPGGNRTDVARIMAGAGALLALAGLALASRAARRRS